MTADSTGGSAAGRPTLDAAVTDVAGRARYEIRVDGELAGFLDYAPHRERLDFVHTEVNPAFGGRGVGTRLVRAALDDLRRRGGRVRPMCSFVGAFLDRNPEYADMVFGPTPDPLLDGGPEDRD